MKRRSFIQKSIGTSAILPLSGGLVYGSHTTNQTKTENKFKLKYAPHFGMFKHHAGQDLLSQLDFMADMGFRAFEDNEMRNREISMQKSLAANMAKNNIEMGVFVAHTIYWKEPNLASGDKNKRKEFLTEIKNSVEVAKRVNARWMTVVPGHLDLKQDMGYQTSNVIETLKRACDIIAPHDLTMVLEPLNFRDHPGLFLTKSSQAYQICKAVDSPACKILFDIYHQQITEGNIIPNIDNTWSEIAYFQIGDNPGRNEPTTGEINYKNIFKHIHKKGFDGILGMEHGNSISEIKGEQALINAYTLVDDF